MTALEPILNHIAPFLMVLSRLSGLLLFAPALGSPIIPAKVRLLIVVMFTLALYPTIPPSQQTPISLDLLSVSAAVFSETLVGLTIGLIATLPMHAAQLGGLMIGQQVGISLGTIYNPALDIESDVLGQLLVYVALAVFLVVGGLESMFLALAQTFVHIPIGGVTLSILPADLFLAITASGFEVALRVSAPIMAVLLFETVATAAVTKTMPQLNITSIGFAIKIVAALVVLSMSIATVEQVFREDAHRTLSAVLNWASNATPPRPLSPLSSAAP